MDHHFENDLKQLKTQIDVCCVLQTKLANALKTVKNNAETMAEAINLMHHDQSHNYYDNVVNSLLNKSRIESQQRELSTTRTERDEAIRKLTIVDNEVSQLKIELAASKGIPHQQNDEKKSTVERQPKGKVKKQQGQQSQSCQAQLTSITVNFKSQSVVDPSSRSMQQHLSLSNSNTESQQTKAISTSITPSTTIVSSTVTTPPNLRSNTAANAFSMHLSSSVAKSRSLLDRFANTVVTKDNSKAVSLSIPSHADTSALHVECIENNKSITVKRNVITSSDTMSTIRKRTLPTQTDQSKSGATASKLTRASQPEREGKDATASIKVHQDREPVNKQETLQLPIKSEYEKQRIIKVEKGQQLGGGFALRPWTASNRDGIGRGQGGSARHGQQPCIGGGFLLQTSRPQNRF